MSGALQVQASCFICKGIYILYMLLIISIDFSFLCTLSLTLCGSQKYQQWVSEGKKDSTWKMWRGDTQGKGIHTSACFFLCFFTTLRVSTSVRTQRWDADCFCLFNDPSSSSLSSPDDQNTSIQRNIITVISAPRHTASLINKKSRSRHPQTHNAQTHLFWSPCCWEPPSSHTH